MKTFTLVISIAVVLLSCKKDPCKDINCLNGSMCTEGTCICLTGFTGDRCETEIEPTSVTINEFRLTRYPVFNGAEVWDPAEPSGPDIFVQVTLNSIIQYEHPTFLKDSGPAPQTFTPASPIILADVTPEYLILLFDNDSPAPHELIGGVSFTPYTSGNGFPGSVTLDDGGDVAFELDLSYAH